MKTPHLAAALLAMSLPLPASAGTFAYISLAGESKIAAYAVDEASGRLTLAAHTPVDGAPGSLTTDAARKHLFVALRGSGKLASYRLDGAGKLTLVSLIPVNADPSYVGVDGSGKYLLSAFYQAGKVMVHRIGPDGALDPNPAAEVLTAPTAHSAVPDPTNRRVFVPHVTPNAVYQFALDSATGRLSPGPQTAAPAGAGPRHLRIHPSGKWAYTSNESGSSVSQYALDAAGGTLSPQQTLSTLPPTFQGSNSCAEVKVHPNGRFVYVSNRGHDSIAAFAVDEATGRLTALGQTATEKTPRCFDIDRTGRFLIAAGEGGTRVAAYTINVKTGALTPIEGYEVGKRPFWVLYVTTP